MPSMPNSTPPDADWTYVAPGQQDFTQVDVVRFLMQDTDSQMPLLADSEVQWLIDEWLPKHDSLYMVAAQAAERVAAKFAGTVTVSADGVSVDGNQLQSKYTQLAVDLRATHKEAQVGGEVDLSNLMAGTGYDWSIDPLSFGVGMHDNLDAGRQDYGTHRARAGGIGAYASDTVRPGE